MASLGTKTAPISGPQSFSLFPDTASEKDASSGANVFRVRKLLFIATDLLGTWGGAFLTIAIRFQRGLLHGAAGTATIAGHVGVVVLYSVLIVLFGHTQRLYSAYQTASVRKEMLAIIKAIAMASVLLTCCLFVSSVKSTSRLVVASTALSAACTMVGWRYVRRQSLRRAPADGLNCHNALVVGTDRLAHAVRDHLTLQRQLGFVVVGLLTAHEGSGGEAALGSVRDLRALCRTHFVDEIIICSHERDIVKRVIAEARHCGVGVRLVPDMYDGIALGAQLDYLGELPTLAVIHRRIPSVELKLKRALDIVGSATALVLLGPLLLLLALIVKLDSHGPVFYISQRVGKKGRIFSCCKFRTMVQHADDLKAELQHLNERDGILFKIKNDPRVTRCGRFMRRYSLDELPQLWNVLKGDMSLVGPRPPLASEVQQYQLEYRRRLEVAPGITGLWQVEARLSPSFDRYISLDLRYVENWSFGLDLRILLRTVAAIFAGTGT